MACLLPPGRAADILRAAANWPHGDGLPSVDGPLDPAVQRLASRHSLLPSLYAWVRQSHPDSMTEELKRARYQSSFVCLGQLALLKKMLTAFESAGIRVLVLKGQALSAQLYGVPDLRPSVDIDLLIDPDRKEQAHDILISLGFRPASQVDIYTLARLTKDALYRSPHGIIVEMHWRLDRNRRLLDWTFSTLWAERETVRADTLEMHTLPSARNAVFLTLHGIHHGWQRLRWLADIALLLRDPEQVRQALVQADRDRARPALLHALALAHHVLAMPLADEHLRDWAACPRAAAIDRLVASWNAVRARPDNGRLPLWLGERWMERRVHLRLCPDWASRFEELSLIFCSTTDRDTYPLPAGLNWLYPVLRPVMLLGRLVRDRRKISPGNDKT